MAVPEVITPIGRSQQRIGLASDHGDPGKSPRRVFNAIFDRRRQGQENRIFRAASGSSATSCLTAASITGSRASTSCRRLPLCIKPRRFRHPHPRSFRHFSRAGTPSTLSRGDGQYRSPSARTGGRNRLQTHNRDQVETHSPYGRRASSVSPAEGQKTDDRDGSFRASSAKGRLKPAKSIRAKRRAGFLGKAGKLLE